MEIKLELLKKEISSLVINSLDNLNIDTDKIADTSAITALAEIQAVIQNNAVSDFEAVEKIIQILEKYHIDTGCRHDF
ncbi:MAG: hypothetical protein ACI4DP_11565 [Candidatus Ornithomonoglobus sp.]